jgi:hypothetical protein
MKSGRSRLPVRAFANAGQAETIDVSFTVPFNCTLLQTSINYSSTPLQADTFAISKVSGFDPRISPIFRIFDIGSYPWPIVICNEPFELLKDDILRLVAGNGNDIDVAVEAILEEGG